MNADRRAAARAIDAFLAALGRDPADATFAGTGERVAAAFADDLCAGYDVDVDRLLSENTIDARTELVVLRDLAVTTTCPHHLMTATGTATVAFAPRAKVIGIGALARLVDAYAHRLTLQEEIGEHVVAGLSRALAPSWAGCRLVLSHACMTARGERRHGARVETVAIAGECDRAVAYRALGAGTP